jgi:putative transposase
LRPAGNAGRRPQGGGTQSVRTGPQRGPRGYDAHKKVNGRKRVLMIDAQGDPLGVRVV